MQRDANARVPDADIRDVKRTRFQDILLELERIDRKEQDSLNQQKKEAETEKAKKDAWKYLTERDEALEMRDIAIQERDEALKDLNALKFTVMKDVFRPRSSNATKKF